MRCGFQDFPNSLLAVGKLRNSNKNQFKNTNFLLPCVYPPNETSSYTLPNQFKTRFLIGQYRLAYKKCLSQVEPIRYLHLSPGTIVTSFTDRQFFKVEKSDILSIFIKIHPLFHGWNPNRLARSWVLPFKIDTLCKNMTSCPTLP